MLISVVIVEYKNMDAVSEAVHSLENYLSDIDYDVVVISNSQYGLQERKKNARRFSDIRCEFNENNIGFGRACNQGMKLTTGKYILLLNPDAKLCDKSTSLALEFMEKREEIAVLGPKIIDSTGTLQDSSRDFMTFTRLFNRTIKRLIKHQDGGIVEYNDIKAHASNWVSGACMLVKRSAISDTGLFDIRYFMYVEDMDWCRTFWQHGWEVWCLPTWVVEHDAGRGSSSRFSLKNRLMWIHISSLIKYYFKWLFCKTTSSTC